jgi:hypothetical protein
MAAEVSKPDFSFQWASGGAIVAPSDVKIQTGWTAEVPPFQWENFAQNRQDNAILHLFQKGISEWDATSNYYFTTSGVRSYVQGSDGNIYVAVQDSAGQNPTTDSTDTYWKIAFITDTSLATFSAASGPVIGSVRNGLMLVTTAASTATYTADEVITKSSLGGAVKNLPSFSHSVNLATVGAGGMDTGSAPISGYVALYAIYNPTTATSALLAKNATLATQTEVYSGASMPSGYTASTLLTVVPTNASGQFSPVFVEDRHVWIPNNVFYTSSTPQASLFIRDTSLVTPFNAKRGDFSTTIASSSATVTMTTSLAGSSAVAAGVGLGEKVSSATSAAIANAGFPSQMPNIPIITPQTIYYRCTVASGTMTFSISCNGYEI